MFKDRLKSLRLQKNLTQQQLAEAIGVGTSTIGKWEGKGNILPSDGVKEKLAAFFNVSMDYLMERSDIPVADDFHIGSDEMEMITIYRNLNESGKRMFADFARMLIMNPDFRQEAQEQSAI